MRLAGLQPIYKIRFMCCSKFSLLHAFFMSYTFVSNTRLKLAKNQANAKQHPEAELLLFENYSHYSSTLSSKNDRTYSKKIIQRIGVSIFMRSHENHNEN